MGWTPPPQPTPFNVKPEDVLFLDSETVPKVELIKNLDEHGRKLFFAKVTRQIDGGPLGKTDEFLQQLWLDNAAFHCEFNKLACVSLGVFTPGPDGERTFRIKSFFGYNEAIILDQIAPKLAAAKYLCAHNGKRFDFPLLGRKYIQHGKQIPSILNVIGSKPWETSLFDTFDVWAFNDLKSYTSLDTLTYIFEIPSPKTNMDGSKVAEVYYGPSKLKKTDLPWDDTTLQPVGTYCSGDVVALGQTYLRLIGQPLVKPENIIIVS